MPRREDSLVSGPTTVASARAQAQAGNRTTIPHRATRPRPQPQKELYVSTQRDYDTDKDMVQVTVKQKRHSHFLVPIGCTMIAMVGMIVLITQVVIPWWIGVQAHWNYGEARVSYQTLSINGNVRDVLGIGYKGMIEVVILADIHDPKSKAQEYLLKSPFPDGKNRVVTLEMEQANQGDSIPDIVIKIEGVQGVYPVLYGRPDGTFQYSNPDQKG